MSETARDLLHALRGLIEVATVDLAWRVGDVKDAYCVQHIAHALRSLRVAGLVTSFRRRRTAHATVYWSLTPAGREALR